MRVRSGLMLLFLLSAAQAFLLYPNARPTSILPARTRVCNCAAGVLPAAGSGDHGSVGGLHIYNWLTQKQKSLLSAVVATLRRFLLSTRRFFSSLILRLGIERVTVTSGVGISGDSARTSANLCIVEGAATRNVAEPDQALAFFNYDLSPFYAVTESLDHNGDGDDSTDGPSVAATGNGVVRWLQHGSARMPTDLELGADEARRAFLAELYAEALKVEKQRRGGKWLGGS